MADNADTREKLRETALRLYAERGAFNVSLAEVVREAGQRNASAIHYHFGSREQLLTAIMEPPIAALAARRHELLAKAQHTPGPEVVVDALVRPLVELAHEGWQARAWMKVGLELADRADRISPGLSDLLFQGGGGDVLDALAERVPPLPQPLWLWRTNICIGFVARAATERARIIDDSPARSADLLADDVFVANLVEMFLGALRAPAPDVG